MGLDHIRAEIEHMRVQIKRQQKDILSIQQAGISTASAIALLERMYAKVDELIGERNRLAGKLGSNSGPMPAAKPFGASQPSQGIVSRLRRFPTSWTTVESDDCFRIFDASGLQICSIIHREDLHARN